VILKRSCRAARGTSDLRVGSTLVGKLAEVDIPEGLHQADDRRVGHLIGSLARH
jgi:hypothetical protein